MRMSHRAAAAAIGVILVSGIAHAGDPAKDASAVPPMDPAHMEAWMKSMTPGEKHKKMEFHLGDWKASTTMWMEGQESKSEGTAHYEWALGGRYMMSRHKGDFNGMPFEGMGIDGYDNVNQEYFSIWMDNMGTGYMASKGKASSDGKSVTYTGTTKDPMTGQMVEHRMVSTITGADTSKFEMWMTTPGAKEVKMMEIVYTRVKS
jgi:hypothetical protein